MKSVAGYTRRFVLSLNSVFSRPRHPNRKVRNRRSLYVDVGVVALLILLLMAVNQGYIRRHAFNDASDVVSAAPTPAQPSSDALPASKALAGYSNPPAHPSRPGKALPPPPISFRPLNYALLRGGFTSIDEFFERVSADPILHSFYGDCSDRYASMHFLSSDVLVFTAFRRGNQIRWAKRPLLVHKGEYVMTYCGKTVLARCGNLISMAAMQPSEDVPPGLLETPEDAIAPPISYASDPVVELATPADATPAAVTPVAAHHGFFFFVPPVYVPPGHSHSGPPTSVTPVPPGKPPASNPPPSTPPSGPLSGPPSGPSAPPPSGPPGPPSHISGDEFSDYGAAVTLLFGLLVIGLLRLFHQ